MKDYEISRPTVINVLKNQFETLKVVDSGIMNDKSKSLKKSSLAELEVFDNLYLFFSSCIFMYFLFSDTPRFSDSFLTDQMCH